MKWSSEQFKEVEWEWVDKALESKPDGYRLWLSKQHSNFCASRVQLAC